MDRLRRIAELSPRRIAVAYFALGGAWLVVTDWLVHVFAPTRAAATALQTGKGWLFVLLSAVLIYALTRRLESQLERSNARLRDAAQQLQVLGRVLRHNIRNDMTVIRGYAELVREHATDATDRDRLSIVAETADDVVDVSEQLRVVSEIDLDADATVDVVALVRRERDHLRATRPAVTIDVSLPSRAVVRGDDPLRRAIRAAVECLLEHGSTTAERRVSITVERAGDEVAIRVTDDGPGIPENELEPVRCGEETDLVHAAGVRIWLLNWLCNVYGGRVAFEDGESGGTVVILRLPAAGGR
ncbi:hypothetical protein MBEHAL_1981 [Halarchaeum acidiphilum MH1-52-1]|uniref:histidine kinase n=1 Tax=Halarchaeum acidiphilum MH1-52-1 TaxID=1261545 RepID=U2YG68_9EURY|nr:HAMP domain-containing sensor histidine kinase [Halarchaeum acidiphilum]GAD53221.1 hypothetical protein MBEHAL_1981 [Halarchaeum acidiphilum MH1-52-1]